MQFPIPIQIWWNWWQILLCSLLVILCSSAISQNPREIEIAKYIPHDHESLEDFPLVTIKVIVHIVQRSEQNPENFKNTEEDRKKIEEIIYHCNRFYTMIQDPTIKVASSEPTVHDSRIRFRLDEIRYHVDSAGWDRNKFTIAHAGQWPLKVDSVNTESNELIFFNLTAHRGFNQSDSLKISTESGPVTLHKAELRKVGKWTILTTAEDLSGLTPVNATYYRKTDLNCSDDNWKRLADQDRHHLHLFFTGSSTKRIQFGCGPSPYFMNVCNFIYGGAWAGWQLTGHEIGHTLGLSHTFYPQFSDLPKKDKKCSGCPSNDSTVSNNIMGYNGSRNYLSPLQIGFVYKNYTGTEKRIMMTTACDYDPDKTITVRGCEKWERSRALQGDLIVKKKATLHLSRDQFLSSGSTIFIEKRGTLIIDNCTVKNGCGDPWNGIVYCKKFSRHKLKKSKRKRGKVVFEGTGKLDMVRENG